jgi:hypothetical protein
LSAAEQTREIEKGKRKRERDGVLLIDSHSLPQILGDIKRHSTTVNRLRRVAIVMKERERTSGHRRREKERERAAVK